MNFGSYLRRGQKHGLDQKKHFLKAEDVKGQKEFQDCWLMQNEVARFDEMSL